MNKPHLLKLNNPRKVKANLVGIIDEAALKCIEAEIEENVRGLLLLAKQYYRFAVRQPSAYWRQRVSRLYYAAYNTARAVRLYDSGDYSTNVKDHLKFNKLPDDFPNNAKYSNQLPILREDRNICDYDHIAVAADLVLGTKTCKLLVEDFLKDAVAFLRTKGMTL